MCLRIFRLFFRNVFGGSERKIQEATDSGKQETPVADVDPEIKEQWDKLFFRNVFGGSERKIQEATDSGKQETPVADVDPEIKEQWDKDVKELKKKLVLEDTPAIREMVTVTLENCDTGSGVQYYVGGFDISFPKDDIVNACAALVVLSYPQLEIVYTDLQMVEMTAPYIAGYLGFRESEFAVQLVDTLKSKKPELVPHVIFVDGNGIFHYHEFGSACHVGVALDMPCIGVAKNLLQVQDIEKNEEHKRQIESLKQSGDTFDLVTGQGMTLGVALRTCDKACVPVYVSQGNHISLKSAAELAHKCSIHRIPEPIRQADFLSRKYLRENFPAKEKVT